MEEGREKRGQAMIEFMFCMIVIFLMIYAIMMVLRWVGSDLAERRGAHDAQLRNNAVVQNYRQCTLYDMDVGTCPLGGCCLQYDSNFSDGPIKQLDPYFYTPIKINAVWGD